MFGALVLTFALLNLFQALRAKFPSTNVFIPGGEIYRAKRDEAVRLVRPLGILASAILAFLAGQWGAMQWQSVLLFTNAVTVGTNDPVMGKDIGFYLFSLPLLEVLKTFAGFTVLATTVMVGLAYYVRGGITLTERGGAVDEKVRKHLAVLAGMFTL